MSSRAILYCVQVLDLDLDTRVGPHALLSLDRHHLALGVVLATGLLRLILVLAWLALEARLLLGRRVVRGRLAAERGGVHAVALVPVRVQLPLRLPRLLEPRQPLRVVLCGSDKNG